MPLKPKITFFTPDTKHPQKLPFVESGIKAGFPSPAADFDETPISLDRELVKNKEATFYARANGDSMTGAGIDNGDILVIDRSMEAQNNKIAVCYIDGEFTVKRIKKDSNCIWLFPENNQYQPLRITEENELIIWGIVTYVIKKI